VGLRAGLDSSYECCMSHPSQPPTFYHSINLGRIYKLKNVPQYAVE